MALNPVLDAEEIARALDAAPIEELIGALVRRAARALALGEAAYHDTCAELDRARRDELLRRCATSARVCRNISEAVHALAPMSAQDQDAAGHARAAVNFDRLAAMRDPNPISGSSPVADLDLGPIEARAAAATPGPWEHRPGANPPGAIIAPTLGETGPRCFITEVGSWGRSADAAFIAASRTDVSKLVAEVRRLRAQVGALERGQEVAQAALAAVLDERDRCWTLLVRAKLVAGYVGRVPSSEGHAAARRFEEDIAAYLAEIAP